ncbi:hypothetical protein JNW88_28310 [Micromonospora sp. ATA32]|nr:hypothetical protein [Micromonospora sp. ATA32]
MTCGFSISVSRVPIAAGCCCGRLQKISWAAFVMARLYEKDGGGQCPVAPAHAEEHGDARHANGGDMRALCDLFGLSIAGAARYANSVNQITEPEAPPTSPT